MSPRNHTKIALAILFLKVPLLLVLVICAGFLLTGCFMVKDHWMEKAKLSLIKDSCLDLCDILDSVAVVHDSPIRVDLNFPGIGNGGLPREDVLPIIEQLPDNVHVWEYR